MNQLSASVIHSAEPTNRTVAPSFMDSKEPTASNAVPPSGSNYDEVIGAPAPPTTTPRTASNQFIVRPIVTGQAAAKSAVIRETTLPLTMRLKNVLRVSKQPDAA